MAVAPRVDQLQVDVHGLAGFLHGAFEHRRDAKLQADRFQIGPDGSRTARSTCAR